MPFQPGDVYTDVPLTQSAVTLFQRDTNFVARRAAPRAKVNKPSGSYHKWKMGDFNRNEMEVRAYNSPPKTATFGRELALYDLDPRSLAYDLNDWVKLASDIAINPATMIPRLLAYKALLNLELLFAGFAFRDTTWFRVVTGAPADAVNPYTPAGQRRFFDDPTTDPVEALRHEVQMQGRLTGRRPTALVLGDELFERVCIHPLIRATLTNGSSPVLRNEAASENDLARLIGVPFVAVGRAIYNVSLEGEPPSNRYIVPPADALLYYRPVDEGTATAGDAGAWNPVDPCAMTKFVWEDAVGNTEGFRIRTYRNEDAGPGGSDRSVADSAHNFGVVSRECGTLLKNMLTP